MSMVALLRPRNPDARNVYASKSLPFAESGAGRYTHRVREFCVINMHAPTFAPHAAASCWCGVTILIGSKPKQRGNSLVSVPSRVLCATCEGRAIGAGQLGAQEIAGQPVMFSPRNGRYAA